MLGEAWWTSPEWQAYAAAYGEQPLERVTLLRQATWLTRVIDLREDESSLWRGVRRSYHAIINKLERAEREGIIGVASVTGASFMDLCLPLHVAVAGRMTRPRHTWELQAQWVDRDIGLALVAMRKRGTAGIEPVGFLYTVRSGKWAYYFSGAYREPRLAHWLQWRAIRVLKAQGVAWYEMGWQGHERDERGRGIEFFKRGFGGFDVPFWWDPDGQQSDIDHR